MSWNKHCTERADASARGQTSCLGDSELSPRPPPHPSARSLKLCPAVTGHPGDPHLLAFSPLVQGQASGLLHGSQIPDPRSQAWPPCLAAFRTVQLRTQQTGDSQCHCPRRWTMPLTPCRWGLGEAPKPPTAGWRLPVTLRPHGRLLGDKAMSPLQCRT